jgi:hypothetical protein
MSSANGDKPLPRSEDCEKGVLCSALLAPAQVMKECGARIDAKMFTPGNGILFDTIAEWDKPGEPVDHIWLKELLKGRGQLEEIGGNEFLAPLYTFVPTAANVAFYIDIVRQKWCEREVIRLGHDLIDGADVGVIYEKLKSLRDAVNEAKKPLIEFLSPSQVKAYVAPPGTLLVGDNHIVRDNVFVIGGPPGVGKSRGTVALAEAGATTLDWIGLKVHCRFRTMIIQNENGRYRLQREFSELDEKILDGYLKISPPPPYGLRFDRGEFRDALKAQIDIWQPGIILIDPWNAVTRDDKQRDYRETFDLVREVIPSGDDAPAIGIVAHTRKPLPNERANGRALLNLLSGSHVLASVPRTIWVMQHASDDVNETRVVVTCCKNNDGELGLRSVWLRENGLWTSVPNFDWKAWDSDGNEGVFTLEEVAQILEKNPKGLRQANLAREIIQRGISRPTAYRRIDEAEKSGLIKFQKGKGIYVLPE